MSLRSCIVTGKMDLACRNFSRNPIKSGLSLHVFVHIHATIQGISKKLMMNSGITASFQFRAFAVVFQQNFQQMFEWFCKLASSFPLIDRTAGVLIDYIHKFTGSCLGGRASVLNSTFFTTIGLWQMEVNPFWGLFYYYPSFSLGG